MRISDEQMHTHTDRRTEAILYANGHFMVGL